MIDIHRNLYFYITLLLIHSIACNSEILTGYSPPNNDSQTTGDFSTKVTCTDTCSSPLLCSAAGICIQPGTCAHNNDCPAQVCNLETKQCVEESECGAQEIKANYIEPNLLLVIDRSCSMTKLVNGKTKWEITVNALNILATNFSEMIRFGLTLFPDITGVACTQDAIQIPIGEGNANKIKSLFNKALESTDSYYPDGPCVTNIDTAIIQATTEPAFNNKNRGNFILLVTDGKQAGCEVGGGDLGTTQTITNLFAQKNIPTFVVGFGDEVDPAQLNIFAKTGGRPQANSSIQFYKAEEQTSFEKALGTISQGTYGCFLKLDQVPADLSKMYVFFDTNEIKQDQSHANGWDYDPATNQLTFYGSACQALDEFKVNKMQIVYGCKRYIENPNPVNSDGGTSSSCSGGAISCNADSQCVAQKKKCTAGCCRSPIDSL